MTGTVGTLDGDVVSAYSLLLHHGSDLGQAELAGLLGRTGPETARLVERLIDMSLVHPPVDHDAKVLVAAHPVMAMQQLIAREHAMLDERWSHLRHSYEVVSAVMPNYVAGKPPVEDDYMPERLDGLAAVRQRLEELSVQAKAEIVSFTPVAADPAAARAASRPLNLGLLRRGVRMRTLYQDSIVVEPDAMGYAVELDGAGGEIRLTPQVPLRLIVMDRSVAVVPLDPSDPAAGAMMIRDPGTVAALMALFENYWRSGRPLSEVMGESGCSEVEKAILRHLAAGSKDEAVARQLGISVRTLRRGIAALMDRLEARSRFELAVLAAQRGWM